MNYIIGVFLIIYGLLSLIMGILNKKKSFFMSSSFDGLEKTLGPNYTRITNIVMGIVSVIAGILIVRDNSGS